MKKIRTRYAPSPTGFFHIGGARTALFNYLFAKHNNGDFIVRIEDTDVERNIEGGANSQLDNLDWLGLNYDESIRNPNPKYAPYMQTQKLDRYIELANNLLNEKKAYYCFCSKEELDMARQQAVEKGETPKYNRRCLNLTQDEIKEKIKANIPKVIRLKINDNIDYKWNDMVRGEISVPASALTDPVILKSNLIPMYNFAVVVDDYDMDITHVIRGEEHISNTPYQIAIKNSLGFDKKDIEYGHLSVIINELGKKLSKRDTSLKQFINDYKNMGILPEAIVNFMSLLGWSNEKNKEIFSLEEATSLFNIKQVSKSPTFFDFKKMMWVSNCYFKNIDDEQYIKFVSPFVTIDLKQLESKKVEILLLFKNQICCAHELNSLITDTFFNQENKNNFNNDIIKASLLKQLQNFSDEISFDEAKNIITNIKTETKLSGKDLFMPIRILLTSCEHGPELNKIMSIMGKKNIGNKLNNM